MFKTPATFLNHVVSPARTFATASVSLAEVKETAKHLGVTFNDIVLATAAGGLRELLLRYDGRADRPLMASVPVSTDTSADRITGNEIGGLSVSLPVHIDDPLERVRLTALATRRAKEDYELLGPGLQGRIMEYLPPPLTPPLLRWQAKRAAHNKLMNVAVSSVPGPRERGHIGGATVTEIYSIGVLSSGSAFNMTVWSYVDQVDISILSDDQTFGEIHEATEAMTHSLNEIRLAAGLPQLSTVATAMGPASAFG
jgi:WS/DGAT/MGAT family acyltransferase